MVLNPEHKLSAIIQHKLEPEIYCLKGLHAFLKIAKQNLQQFPIHIKVDTGMHRLGFEENTIDELIATLKGKKPLKCKVFYRH
jgi:alanine racemase